MRHITDRLVGLGHFGGHLPLDLAAADHQCLLGHQAHFFRVVADEEKGDGKFSENGADFWDDPLFQRLVETGQWFVKQNQPRVGEDAPTQSYPLALTTRNLSDILLQQMANLQKGDHTVWVNVAFFLWQAFHAIKQVFANAHVREQACLLKDDTDPAALRPVLTTRTELRHSERYLETMNVTQDKMDAADGYLASIENALQRAKELGISAVNSSRDDDNLNTIADEIAGIRSQLLDTANASIGGKYIFSGYQENTPPFTANPNYDPAAYDAADSTTWPYQYNGDNKPTQMEIGPNEYVETSITGNELFLGVSNSNWTSAGTAASGQPEEGHVDVFSVLTRLEEALRAGNLSDENGPGGGVQQQTGNLEIAADQERRLRSHMGVQASHVESSMFRQEDIRDDLKQLLSRYEDTDPFENFSAILQQESSLQAALSITARVSEISILDYLR